MALGPNVIARESFGSDHGVLPKELVSELFQQVGRESLALQLAGTTPININGATTTYPVGRPVAGVVGEGEAKPLIKGGFATKTIEPIKVAAIAVNSTEARLANPNSYFDGLQVMMKDALVRAVDLAIFHGKDGIKNTIIPGVEYVDQTTNAVRLGTNTPAEGGLQRDLLDGWSAVARKRKPFTGFAADGMLIPDLYMARLYGAVDPNGRPLFQPAGADVSQNVGSLIGLPVTWNDESVSGFVGAVPDTYVRAYGGDFKDNIRLGFVEQITYKRTDQATIIDGDTTLHLWQQNLEAYLIEAIFGWVIKDVDAFAKYTVAPDAFTKGTSYAKDSLVTYNNAEYKALVDVANASQVPSTDTEHWEKISA